MSSIHLAETAHAFRLRIHINICSFPSVVKEWTVIYRSHPPTHPRKNHINLKRSLINSKYWNVKNYNHLIIYLLRYVKCNIRDTSEFIHFTKNTYKKEHNFVDFRRASQSCPKMCTSASRIIYVYFPNSIRVGMSRDPSKSESPLKNTKITQLNVPKR